MNLNPFDLRGPQFLLFFAVLSILARVLLGFIRRLNESGEIPRVPLSDPYAIAFLRGGAAETLRAASLVLIERKLLSANENILTTASGAEEQATSPIERKVLNFFKTPQEAHKIFEDKGAEQQCSRFETSLVQSNLLPSETQLSYRFYTKCALISLLLTVAASKIILAIQRGKHNVLFLIIMSLGALLWLLLTNPRRTVVGDQFLHHMRAIFKHLKSRVESTYQTSSPTDLAFLVAVFGVSALPALRFPYVKKLYPKASSSNYSCSTTSCGSSCGSSCGGGCGGGCGGCGS